jgi:hypothetical protein
MRALHENEVEIVAGGDWSVTINLPFVDVKMSGPESIQDVLSGVGDAYGGAVDYMADFFTWWDPAGFYSSCGGGGGR